jgi:HAD superfamily hydrolase (TIGR01509 family)
MVRAVLFDFDGVIVQSEPLHMKTFLDLLEPYGVEVSKERWYREFAGTGSRRIFKALTEEYGIDADIEELVTTRRRRFIEHARNGELDGVPGLREFLAYLQEKGIRAAIVSGGHRSYIEILLELLGLESSFEFIISADDIKERKPDPTPFLLAAKRLGIESKDCLVIEDSYSGCEAARHAGMMLAWMRPDGPMEAPACDAEISDFFDSNLLGLFA